MKSSKLPTIASMWIGNPMSFVEQIVMKSFIANGHDFILYCLEDVGPVPKGVTVKDARDIYPPKFEVGENLRHNNAVYTDLFRLFMIRETGAIWADMDAYCVRPFQLDTEFVFGIEIEPDAIANGILGLPKSSKTLEACIDLISQDAPIPPYFINKRKKRLQTRMENGETFGFEEFSWGNSGPRLLSHFLHETGENVHAQPKNVFYPGPRAFRRPLLNPDMPITTLETPETLSVHIYGKTKSFLVEEFDGIPPKGSYLDTLCKRHDVDPMAFPIPISKPVKRNTTIIPSSTPHKKPLEYLIVSTMKNEGPYIIEWIAHNLSIGFDGFLIFTNDCDDLTDRILDRLEEMGLVYHRPNPKELMGKDANFQVLALRYARMFNQYQDAKWIYHTDVDEFLHIKVGSGKLDDFFAKVPEADVVSFTSIPFNSNNIKILENERILPRFTQKNRDYRKLKAGTAQPVHTAIKTIYKNSITFDLRRNHRPLHKTFSDTGFSWMNGSGSKMPAAFTDEKIKFVDALSSTDFAEMHHHAIRSTESYLIKVARGDVVGSSRLNASENYWENYNTRGEDDLCAASPTQEFTRIYNDLMADPILNDLHTRSFEIHKKKVETILQTEGGEKLARSIGYFD